MGGCEGGVGEVGGGAGAEDKHLYQRFNLLYSIYPFVNILHSLMLPLIVPSTSCDPHCRVVVQTPLIIPHPKYHSSCYGLTEFTS